MVMSALRVLQSAMQCCCPGPGPADSTGASASAPSAPKSRIFALFPPFSLSADEADALSALVVRARVCVCQ